MTAQQASQLLKSLRSAFPALQSLGEETIRLYHAELRPLNYDIAEKAVRSCIVGCRFFPSIAEFNTQLMIVREQVARDQKEEERKREAEHFDNLPRPELRSIPAVRDYLEVNHLAPALPSEGRGECTDCGQKRVTVYRLGKVRPCAPCARRRLNANAA